MCDFEFHLRQAGALVQLFQYFKNDFFEFYSFPFARLLGLVRHKKKMYYVPGVSSQGAISPQPSLMFPN